MENNIQTVKIKQNLDTNFLKIIAISSMVIDHFSKVFWPDNMILAILGRIAFPLFAYCLVVGCLYTSNFKKYVLRLAIFAVVSQPFAVLGFASSTYPLSEYILSANIFFTLTAGALLVRGLMNVKKYWWMILIAIVMEAVIGLDYSFYGLILIAIFYLCRNKSWLSCLLAALWMCTMILGDFITVFGIGLDRQIFALLALPLIYIHTNVNPKINKYFFYVFYPAHLLLLFVLKLATGNWI